MRTLFTPPPPPPMPNIRPALLLTDDASKALGRYAWNQTQLEDNIRSAEFFLDLAKKALAKKD